MRQDFTIIMFKTLSRNDTGETKSHQSGISIPKDVAKTDLFPHLGIETLNPRRTLVLYDEDGAEWHMEYVYYNDKYHGKDAKQSHDEYRLTCVTKYVRKVGATVGDSVWFAKDELGKLYIGIKKASQVPIFPLKTATEHASVTYDTDGMGNGCAEEESLILDPMAKPTTTVIKLSKNWTKVEL